MFLVSQGKQSICAGPLLPHLSKGATLLGISEGITLKSKRLFRDKGQGCQSCVIYITMDQAVDSRGDSRGGLCGGDWHSSPRQPCSPSAARPSNPTPPPSEWWPWGLAGTGVLLLGQGRAWHSCTEKELEKVVDEW